MNTQCNVKRDTVILFTNSFPYGYGEQFLETEIKYIEAEFEHLHIVPSKDINTSLRDISDRINIVKELAKIEDTKTWKLKIFIHALRSSLLYQEVLKHPISLIKLSIFKQIVLYVGEAKRTYQWLAKYVVDHSIDLNSTILYTYWLSPQSLSAFFIKKKYPDVKFISRAHRLDLYEEIQHTNFIPLRYLTIKSMDTLFCISEHGRKYLESKYSDLSYKYQVSKLGVDNPKCLNPYSKKKSFTIVSCSFIVAVKRINLIVEGIYYLSRLQPDLLIEWHHFGDGLLREDIESLAEKFPLTVKAFFKGQVENHQVINFYKSKSIDVFINVSESEGIPVSIMEAQSFGIPVIATSVGGNPEIVNDNNGILLEADPTPETIGKSLQQFVVDNKKTYRRRKESKDIFLENYNAEKNYSLFVKKLMR